MTVTSNVVKVTVAGVTVAQAIKLSVTPTSLPASGGTITISGAAIGISAGTSISILINGRVVDTVALGSAGTFSQAYAVPANTSTSPETLNVEATA